MSTASHDCRIQAMVGTRHLRVPKVAYSRDRVTRVVGADAVSESSDSWLVKCTQHPNPPATPAEIDSAEQALGYALPVGIRRLLLCANGGRFYAVPLVWQHDVFPNATHVRYHIFSCSELIEYNCRLLQTFHKLLGDDPDFVQYERLNYLAFCDAHNGNYLAALLEGSATGRVFLLDREYSFRPYSDLDSDLYYSVADSLETWLDLVQSTGGWGGFGQLAPPL
jgi:hypothetical protein